jgi:ubiquinone/menaquinone biosynthesis C-methylase UbiE
MGIPCMLTGRHVIIKNQIFDMEKITTPAELMETVNAFRMSRLILSAFELRVFDHLSGKDLTSSDIASVTGADRRAMDRLLNALTGTGLVHKKNGSFSNTAFSDKFLVSSSPFFMSGLDHTVGLWKTWSTLTDAVKAGKSVSDKEKHEINERGQDWLEAFIATMHARGVAQGRELAALLDLSETHKTLDVGGGSGAFTFAFIERNPAIEGVILDLPNVVPITRKYIEKAGFAGKVTIQESNYLHDDFGNGFDLVLMSAIIHINSPEENRLLIRKGTEALGRRGQLVIMDHLMNEERTEPFIGALFALNMLVGTAQGDTYTENELRGWMQDAGLSDIRLVTAESGMQFIVSKKR